MTVDSPIATVAEAHLAAMLRWHFDPATGSPFWVDRAATLGFDPIGDIRSVADLRRFPDVTEELRVVAAERLIPAGRRDLTYGVYETGGTLGAPKRVVEHDSRWRMLDWVSDRLAAHGLFGSGHWLHAGPTGPHLVGRGVRRLAELSGALCYTIDFDPRWVKRLIATGRPDVAAEYVEHVVDQIELVAANQDIRVLFITPAVLDAVCARQALHERLRERLHGLIWSGTSISPATLALVEEVFFPRTTVVGVYGNSLMGMAPQRVRHPDDSYRCVFQTFAPQSIVEVVDPVTGDPVDYGERGRVRVHLLSRDLFLPNVAERDTAVRVRPVDPSAADELADVQPFRVGAEPVVEGVY